MVQPYQVVILLFCLSFFQATAYHVSPWTCKLGQRKREQNDDDDDDEGEEEEGKDERQFAIYLMVAWERKKQKRKKKKKRRKTTISTHPSPFPLPQSSMTIIRRSYIRWVDT